MSASENRSYTKDAEDNPSDSLDILRRDILTFAGRLPEPPVYRRRDDPVNAAIREHIREAQPLIERADRLHATVARSVLDAHLAWLTLAADGDLVKAEVAWRHALEIGVLITTGQRSWRTNEETVRPVFERDTGVSRFDPRPAPELVVKLACPRCRCVEEKKLTPAVALHTYTCGECRTTYEAYLAELRTCEIKDRRGGGWSYCFRVEDLSGALTRIEFDDTSGAQVLAAARRDLLAFIYQPHGQLRGVVNLHTSRVLWFKNRTPCFVATVAFGEGAPQLTVLRDFRDEVLMRSAPGRLAVSAYYRLGPPAAKFVERHPTLKVATRHVLSTVVRGISQVRPRQTGQNR